MNGTDLNEMSRDELKAQAEVLNLEYPKNITDDALREKIREALGDVQPDPQPATAPTPNKAKGRMFRGQIHKDGKDKQPVPVAVNGHVLRIKRGEEVTIPEAHYVALNNAIQMVWDADAGDMIEVPAYPNSFQPVEG